MEQSLEVSPKKFYEKAKHMLEKKDLLEFVSQISVAIETSRNDKQMLAKSTFLEATGLVTFNQHRKALKSITEALKYNTGIDAFKLRKQQGIAKGYLGDVDEAYQIFKDLLKETEEIDLLIDLYINISWVCLLLYKNSPDHKLLAEIKFYLDLVNQHFASISDKCKFRLLNNYSVYYFYAEQYAKAIKSLEAAIEHCIEYELADIYRNLAELYLKLDEDEEVLELAKNYLEKAEMIGNKYSNDLALGYIFNTKAIIHLREDQVFTALDTLYLSVKFFKDAEATIKVSDALAKIKEIMKSLGQFVTNISEKELLSGSRELFFNAKSVKTKGLFEFIRQKKLLESVSQRVDDGNDTEMMDLKIYEGIVYGYLGKLDQSLETFKSIIKQTKNPVIMTKSYLNIAWLSMAFDKKASKDLRMKDAKKYLDLAHEDFDSLPDSLKCEILTSYSAYYYYEEDYDKAMTILQKSIQYSEEESLSEVYNNLVELSLKSMNTEGFSENARKFLEKAEVLGAKYHKPLSLGQTFYLRAEIELREDQFFTALDTLYLSFEHFKQAEATVLACSCLLKINQLIDGYEQNNLEALKKLKKRLAKQPEYKDILSK